MFSHSFVNVAIHTCSTGKKYMLKLVHMRKLILDFLILELQTL